MKASGEARRINDTIRILEDGQTQQYARIQKSVVISLLTTLRPNDFFTTKFNLAKPPDVSIFKPT
jgi:hypothetical protein